MVNVDHNSLVVYLTHWKNMSSSIGMMTFPTEWENKKCSKPPTSCGKSPFLMGKITTPMAISYIYVSLREGRILRSSFHQENWRSKYSQETIQLYGVPFPSTLSAPLHRICLAKDTINTHPGGKYLKTGNLLRIFSQSKTRNRMRHIRSLNSPICCWSPQCQDTVS